MPFSPVVARAALHFERSRVLAGVVDLGRYFSVDAHFTASFVRITALARKIWDRRSAFPGCGKSIAN